MTKSFSPQRTQKKTLEVGKNRAGRLTLLSQIKLKPAAGTLSEDDLKQINQWLE